MKLIIFILFIMFGSTINAVAAPQLDKYTYSIIAICPSKTIAIEVLKLKDKFKEENKKPIDWLQHLKKNSMRCEYMGLSMYKVDKIIYTAIGTQPNNKDEWSEEKYLWYVLRVTLHGKINTIIITHYNEHD